METRIWVLAVEETTIRKARAPRRGSFPEGA